MRENLDFLPAGSPTTAAAELFTGGDLGVALKHWSPGYDVILVDSPPALTVADPILIAPYSTGVMLVVEAGRTSQDALRRVADSMALAEAQLLGVVLNKFDPRSREGYYGYGYGYGGYGYTAKPAAKD